MLHKRLNYDFEEKKEQKYIYLRLNLLDQHYCLKVDLNLWQSYLQIGLETDRWPVSFYLFFSFIIFPIKNNIKGRATLCNGKHR